MYATCPYPCAWKLSAVPTSHTLIGKCHVLGRTLGPARAAGGGRKERLNPGKVSAFIRRQETAGKVSGKETLAPPEREESFPYVPNPLQCTSKLKHFIWFLQLPSIKEILTSPLYREEDAERGEVSCSRSQRTADTRSSGPVWSPYQSVLIEGPWAPSFLRIPWFCSMIINISIRRVQISLSLCLMGRRGGRRIRRPMK